MAHTSVLLQEVVDGLATEAGMTLLDGTLGEGGHSAAVAERLGGNIRIIGLDLDSAARERSRVRLESTGATLDIVGEDFRNLDRVLDTLNVSKVDRIILDLGVSSNHYENAGRGFSVRLDEPLVMTLGEGNPTGFTARDVVNDWDEENLVTILQSYGDERFAPRIARAIVERRKVQPIERSTDLAGIVADAMPGQRSRIHPATKTFQALRIAVNDELGALKEGLEKGWQYLVPKGRMAVISFHSLEDRIVKEFGKRIKAEGEGVASKHPIVPEREEVARNPRSRSAKLRILEKF